MSTTVPSKYASGNHFNVIERFSRLIKGIGARFTGEDFRSLCKPTVYMFLRNGEPLYVGYSRQGLGRALNTHKQADKARQECDEVLTWPCRDVISAQQVERILIAHCRPVYNVRCQLKRARRRRTAIRFPRTLAVGPVEAAPSEL